MISLAARARAVYDAQGRHGPWTEGAFARAVGLAHVSYHRYRRWLFRGEPLPRRVDLDALATRIAQLEYEYLSPASEAGGEEYDPYREP